MSVKTEFECTTNPSIQSNKKEVLMITLIKFGGPY